MNIGIYDINQSSDLDYKKRLEIYKECGFEELGIYLDDKYMNATESYEQIITYARILQLDIRQVHLDYESANLIASDNNQYFEYITNKISQCSAFNIPCLIVHASKGSDAPIISGSNLNKLKIVAEDLNSQNIKICFENVRENVNLEKIIQSNISNIRVCYDIGHEACYSRPYEILDKYFENIACVHLHNNFGTDSHNVLDEGIIDYKYIMKRLSKLELNSVCLECFPKREVKLNEAEFIEFVKKCYQSIENLI